MESTSGPNGIVDVIIPVYGGPAEVRACLESVLASDNSMLGSVIVINDCSPEPEINDYLQALSEATLIPCLLMKRIKASFKAVTEALRFDQKMILYYLMPIRRCTAIGWIAWLRTLNAIRRSLR